MENEIWMPAKYRSKEYRLVKNKYVISSTCTVINDKGNILKPSDDKRGVL